MAQNIFIALGTNLGKREKNLSEALDVISDFFGITVKSSIYESKPWGFSDQPNFLNMAIQGKSDLTPIELLNQLKHCEAKLGREPNFRYGPRLIDMDIIFFDQDVVNTEKLTIPHPHYLDRDFVLFPLCEISPFFIPPSQKRTLLDIMKETDHTDILLHEIPDLLPIGLRRMVLEPELFNLFKSLNKQAQRNLCRLLNLSEFNTNQILSDFSGHQNKKD